jgi:hypothetical protein
MFHAHLKRLLAHSLFGSSAAYNVALLVLPDHPRSHSRRWSSPFARHLHRIFRLKPRCTQRNFPLQQPAQTSELSQTACWVRGCLFGAVLASLDTRDFKLTSVIYNIVCVQQCPTTTHADHPAPTTATTLATEIADPVALGLDARTSRGAPGRCVGIRHKKEEEGVYTLTADRVSMLPPYYINPYWQVPSAEIESPLVGPTYVT